MNDYHHTKGYRFNLNLGVSAHIRADHLAYGEWLPAPVDSCIGRSAMAPPEILYRRMRGSHDTDHVAFVAWRIDATQTKSVVYLVHRYNQSFPTDREVLGVAFMQPRATRICRFDELPGVIEEFKQACNVEETVACL